MAAVKQAQLHGFERAHVRHHLHALHFPVRTPEREMIFDHPLTEALAHHCRTVMTVELLLQPGERRRIHCRNDAVDHAAGKRHLLLHPLRKLKVLRCGQATHRLTGALTVVRHVVAAQHGKGRDACLVPAAQSLQHNPGRGTRCLGVSQIVDNHRVLQVQLPRSRAQVIAFFSDGQGNDPRARVGHALQQQLQLITAIACVQRFTQHGDVAQRYLLTVTVLGHRIAALLLAQLLDQRSVGAQVGAAHPPLAFTVAIEMALQIDRLMSAMKRSQAQMHDSDFSCSCHRGDTLNDGHQPSPQEWLRAERGWVLSASSTTGNGLT